MRKPRNTSAPKIPRLPMAIISTRTLLIWHERCPPKNVLQARMQLHASGCGEGSANQYLQRKTFVLKYLLWDKSSQFWCVRTWLQRHSRCKSIFPNCIMCTLLCAVNVEYTREHINTAEITGTQVTKITSVTWPKCYFTAIKCQWLPIWIVIFPCTHGSTTLASNGLNLGFSVGHLHLSDLEIAGPIPENRNVVQSIASIFFMKVTPLFAREQVSWRFAKISAKPVTQCYRTNAICDFLVNIWLSKKQNHTLSLPRWSLQRCIGDFRRCVNILESMVNLYLKRPYVQKTIATVLRASGELKTDLQHF